MAPAGLHRGFRALMGKSEGFLDEHRFPREGGGDDLLGMMAVGRREHDGIDGWILESALQVAVDCQPVQSGKGRDSNPASARQPR